MLLYSRMVEEMLAKAAEDGVFDDLEGKGRRLNLDAYFDAPEDLRAGYSVLKSSKFVPEEVELMRAIGELREKIDNCSDETEKLNLSKQLGDRSLALSLILERNRTRRIVS